MDNKVISDLCDLRYLSWTKIRRSSGTAGSFLKAQEIRNGVRYYYKLSDFDPFRGIVGHECVNEIIVDRLLTLLRIPHLEYQLIHALIAIEDKEYETYLCRSKDFKEFGESKIALDVYYQMERLQNESPLDFCLRMGWKKYVRDMLIIDFLILNRDRHGANIEILRNREAKTLRLAPLFDHGISLYFSTHEESDLNGEDPLADKKIQSFVGGSSAMYNLKLIPPEDLRIIEKLEEKDREYLFYGLDDVFSEKYQDAVLKLIWTRWKYYESICYT